MNKKEKNKPSVMPSQSVVPAFQPNRFPALNPVSKKDSVIRIQDKAFKEHVRLNV